MQIQISWLLKDLHCLQRQGISGFSRTRVNWVPLSEKVLSIMHKMCGFTSSCTWVMSHPSICSLLKLSIVSNDSLQTVKVLIRLHRCAGWLIWAFAVHICLKTHFHKRQSTLQCNLSKKANFEPSQQWLLEGGCTVFTRKLTLLMLNKLRCHAHF